MTVHCVSADCTACRSFIDLNNLQDYLSSRSISSQDVLNAIQDSITEFVQPFVATTNNAAPARLKGDALVGYTGMALLTTCCHCSLTSRFTALY